MMMLLQANSVQARNTKLRNEMKRWVRGEVMKLKIWKLTHSARTFSRCWRGLWWACLTFWARMQAQHQLSNQLGQLEEVQSHLSRHCCSWTKYPLHWHEFAKLKQEWKCEDIKTKKRNIIKDFTSKHNESLPPEPSTRKWRTVVCW